MSPELKELSEAKGVQGIAMLVKSSGTDMKALAELLQSGKLKRMSPNNLLLIK